MADYAIDQTVDITDVVCPVTFIKAKVALEELKEGQILSVRLNDGEPVQNVPRSIKEDGHQILKLKDNGDGTYSLKHKWLVTLRCIDASIQACRSQQIIFAWLPPILSFTTRICLSIFPLSSGTCEIMPTRRFPWVNP